MPWNLQNFTKYIIWFLHNKTIHYMIITKYSQPSQKLTQDKDNIKNEALCSQTQIYKFRLGMKEGDGTINSWCWYNKMLPLTTAKARQPKSPSVTGELAPIEKKQAMYIGQTI